MYCTKYPISGIDDECHSNEETLEERSFWSKSIVYLFNDGQTDSSRKQIRDRRSNDQSHSLLSNSVCWTRPCFLSPMLISDIQTEDVEIIIRMSFFINTWTNFIRILRYWSLLFETDNYLQRTRWLRFCSFLLSFVDVVFQPIIVRSINGKAFRSSCLLQTSAAKPTESSSRRSFIHSFIAMSLNHIVLDFYQNQKVRGSLQPAHPSLADVHRQLNNYSRVLTFHRKSLEIKKKSLPPFRPTLSNLTTARFLSSLSYVDFISTARTRNDLIEQFLSLKFLFFSKERRIQRVCWWSAIDEGSIGFIGNILLCQ